MIRLVTKETFNKSWIPGKFKWKAVRYANKEVGDWIDELTSLGLHYYPYFLIDNKPLFINIYQNQFIVPENYNTDPLFDTTQKLDLTEWKIKKISDDTPYIMNVYHRGVALTTWNEDNYESGEYLIENDKTGEKLKCSVLLDITDYSEYSYVSYPGKAVLPVGCGEIERLNEFYKLIIKSNGKEYKRLNSKS